MFSSLNSAEINCLASRILADTVVNWRGVFARDQVSTVDRRQPRLFALVVNTDQAEELGTHWVVSMCLQTQVRPARNVFYVYGMLPVAHAFSHLAFAFASLT